MSLPYLTLPQERFLAVVFHPAVHVPKLVVAPQHEDFVGVFDLCRGGKESERGRGGRRREDQMPGGKRRTFQTLA